MLGRYAVYGIFFFPVIYHKWYKVLEATFPGTSSSAIAKKTLTDQFVLEPPLIVCFYTGMSAMEGKEDLTAETKAKIHPNFHSEL